MTRKRKLSRCDCASARECATHILCFIMGFYCDGKCSERRREEKLYCNTVRTDVIGKMALGEGIL